MFLAVVLWFEILMMNSQRIILDKLEQVFYIRGVIPFLHVFDKGDFP
jgi:hypothetical protein